MQAQQGFQDIWGCKFKKNNTQGIQYLNFYGNLIKLVDSYLVMLMDTLDELGLTKDTVVVRTADHGEMGEHSKGRGARKRSVTEIKLRSIGERFKLAELMQHL